MPNDPVQGRDPSRDSTERDAVSSRLGDGGVLVNLQTNQIFELNATGMRAWELIGEGRTRAELERLEANSTCDAGRVRARSTDC